MGSRIDIVLTVVRIGFFFSDTSIVTEYMAKAEKLIDEGGDWDRRNRLKVYRALHFISIRQFKRAADLFLDALSTFTALEVISFNDFVAMAVVSGALTLGRVDLKKKVITAPEVNQVIPELPVLGDLVKNLYECHYDKFFVALATLEQSFLIPSRILHPHARYYVREMRILAYAQLLESYRSLTLESLARAFGVSVEFIDRYVSIVLVALILLLTSSIVRSPGSSPTVGYTHALTGSMASLRRLVLRRRTRSTRPSCAKETFC